MLGPPGHRVQRPRPRAGILDEAERLFPAQTAIPRTSRISSFRQSFRWWARITSSGERTTRIPDCIWPDSRHHLEVNLSECVGQRAAQDHLRKRGQAVQPRLSCADGSSRPHVNDQTAWGLSPGQLMPRIGVAPARPCSPGFRASCLARPRPPPPPRAFLELQHGLFREKCHVRRDDGVFKFQQRVIRRRVRVHQYVEPGRPPIRLFFRASYRASSSINGPRAQLMRNCRRLHQVQFPPRRSDFLSPESAANEG